MQRLINQQVVGQNHDTAESVVRWMGAMQAQDYKQALWAIGTRMQSAVVADVEKSIAEAKIVRTWTQRGTIHFVPAEDTLWMLKLCASRIVASHGRRMSQLGLTHETMTDCEKLVVNTLMGGKSLTRAEIFKLFDDVGIPTTGQRGYHILWHLAHLGIICMGVMQGKEQTFVLLDEWVTNLRDLSREEALTELVWRYFSSHGPATEHDFARWSGLTLTDTRMGIHNNDTRLQPMVIDDTTYWTAHTPSMADAHGVYLLPAYDEFLLGYQNRSAVLADEYAQQVVPGNNGVFQPIIVVDGQVVGTWKHSIKQDIYHISSYPFTTIDDIEIIRPEVRRFCRFIDTTPE
jgi:hypothetical protein